MTFAYIAIKETDMSKFVDFVRDIFIPGKKYNVSDKLPDARCVDGSTLSLYLSQFAVDLAINLISGLIAKTEFKTYSNNREFKGEEWKLWNLSPNPNQSADAFKSEIIHKLLRRNKVLIVDLGGSLYIADDFEVSSDIIYPISFSSVTLKGKDGSTLTLQKTFSMNDVLYLEWTDKNVADLLQYIEESYDALVTSAMKKYKRSNGRKGIAKIDKTASGSDDEKEKLRQLFAEGFKHYFNDENGLVVLPRGVEYTELQKPDGSSSMNEVNNLTGITKEAISRAAQAFRIPPAILLGEIADTSAAFSQLLTSCVDPLVHAIETEILRKRYSVKMLDSGTCLKVDASCLEHVDIFKVAASADKAIADGTVSIDEVRVRIGLPPLMTWWSQKHWMTKNYSDIESIEEGEKGGNDG
jgi:HK97 family phage portal protein